MAWVVVFRDRLDNGHASFLVIIKKTGNCEIMEEHLNIKCQNSCILFLIISYTNSYKKNLSFRAVSPLLNYCITST